MIKNNLKINSFALILGTAFFLLAGAFAFWFIAGGGSKPEVLAEVAHERGYAWKMSGFGAARVKIVDPTNWRLNQTLITDPIGQLRFSWLKDKSEWLILEDSEVYLFKLGQQPIIKIKKGEIAPLKWSKKESFKIQQMDGRIVEIYEYLGSKAVDPTEDSSLNETAATVDNNQLFSSAIERTRPQLMRCYSKFMNVEDRTLRYSITARFNYSVRLGISQLSLQSLPPIERDFEKCLMDILSLLSIPQYRGPTIDIEVPIEFE